LRVLIALKTISVIEETVFNKAWSFMDKLSISNGSFSSINSFINFFRENKTLEINPPEELHISDISEGYWRKEEFIPLDTDLKILNVLNKMISPLGYCFGVGSANEKMPPCKCQFTEKEFSLKPLKKLVVTKHKKDILTPLRDVFYMMVIHSITTLKLDPKQTILIGPLSQKEGVSQSSRYQLFLLGLQLSQPYGVKVRGSAAQISVQSDGQIVVAQPQSEMTFTLEYPGGFVGLDRLMRHLEKHGTLTIPAQRKFVIEDSDLSRAISSVSSELNGKTMEVLFYINQALLIGKKALIYDHPPKDMVTHLGVEKEGITIVPPQELVLRISQKELETTFASLAREMLNHHLEQMTLEPGQSILFREVSDVIWSKYRDKKSRGLKVKERSLRGFCLKLSVDADAIKIGALKDGSLQFSAESPLQVTLMRMGGKDFIDQLILIQPSLKTQLKHWNEDTKRFIIFKFLSLYTCSSFSSWLVQSIPFPFTEKTKQTMSTLLQKDSEFTLAFQKIQENAGLMRAWSQLVNKQPVELKEVAIDALPDTIKKVFSQLINLTQDELKIEKLDDYLRKSHQEYCSI
jgi:hypothetical protein